MPYITVRNQRGEERQIWWESPRPPTGEEIANLVRQTQEPPPSVGAPGVNLSGQRQAPSGPPPAPFNKPTPKGLLGPDPDLRAMPAAQMPADGNQVKWGLDAVRAVMNTSPVEAGPSLDRFQHEDAKYDMMGGGAAIRPSVGNLLTIPATIGGPVTAGLASAPFIASGAATATDSTLPGWQRALGVLESLGGAAGASRLLPKGGPRVPSSAREPMFQQQHWVEPPPAPEPPGPTYTYTPPAKVPKAKRMPSPDAATQQAAAAGGVPTATPPKVGEPVTPLVVAPFNGPKMKAPKPLKPGIQPDGSVVVPDTPPPPLAAVAADPATNQAFVDGLSAATSKRLQTITKRRFNEAGFNHFTEADQATQLKISDEAIDELRTWMQSTPASGKVSKMPTASAKGAKVRESDKAIAALEEIQKLTGKSGSRGQFGGDLPADIDTPTTFDAMKDSAGELDFWKNRQKPSSELGAVDPQALVQGGIYAGKMAAGGYGGGEAAEKFWGEDITPGRKLTGIIMGGLGGGLIPTPALGGIGATGGAPMARALMQAQYEMLLTGAAQATNAIGSHSNIAWAPIIEAMRTGDTTALKGLGRAAMHPGETASNWWNGTKEGWNLRGPQHQVDLPAEMQPMIPGPGLRGLEAMDMGPRRVMEQIGIPEEMLDTYLLKNPPKTDIGKGISKIASTSGARVIEPFHKSQLGLLEGALSLSPVRFLDRPFFRPRNPDLPTWQQGTGLRNVFPATSRASDLALAIPGTAAFFAGMAGLTPSNPTYSTAMGPLTAAAQIGRSIYDYGQYDKSVGDFPQIREALRAVANNIPLAQTLPRLMDSPEKTFTSLGNRLFPQVAMMPAFGGEGGDILREPESIGDAFMERFPGKARNSLPPRPDFFGQLQHRNFIGQAPPPLYESNPYARTLGDMGLLERGQSNQIPGMHLSPGEQAQLEGARGQRMFSTLKPFLDNPELLANFPDWQTQVLDQIPEPRRSAMRSLLSIGSSGVPTKPEDVYRQIKQLGISVGTEEFLADYARRKAAELTGGAGVR